LPRRPHTSTSRCGDFQRGQSKRGSSRIAKHKGNQRRNLFLKDVTKKASSEEAIFTVFLEKFTS
jgi:hypothetical protein